MAKQYIKAKEDFHSKKFVFGWDLVAAVLAGYLALYVEMLLCVC
jgi:hypothetical protein